MTRGIIKRNPFKTIFGRILSLLLALSGTSSIADSFNNKVAESLQGDWGRIKLDLRWRFENVDQQGLGIANGDPIRMRLGYLTPKIHNFQAFAEFEGNIPVFVDQYNSVINGKTQFPVIADPQAAEVNQGWISYTGIPDTRIKTGRQEINYDNQRFLGTVPWRQMEQTFDSLTVLNETIGNSEFNATYIWNVKTVVSKDINMSSPMLNLAYIFPDIGKLTAYAYLLDYSGSQPANLRFSSQSYGLRFNGRTGVMENLKVLLTAEYAYQRDYQNNPNRYNANYLHFNGGLDIPDLAWTFTNLTGKIGWEQLGSNNNVGFQTPLGTNHAFNGWADQFLVTPPKGIQDLYGVLSAKFFGVQLLTVYHQFDSAVGGINYGYEIDALVVKKFTNHYTVLFKYANYFARNFATDTQKFWVSIDMNF